ncbi:PE family protein [Mycolicibacter longobardus]|uniref:PE family protein n=1 Tax=Mycolicibacter longobardus TaxID=1108812 RepID=A0A1X1YPC2_9MYCO|nr:PE family protein [Mycolicibacter longobardus]MCV7384365.1 PE family protein [Mycolicibacter longobardus]ORW12851.1 PE family protein [Mycolicibacter longobardus]
MSFVTAQPENLTAAAGSLSGIGDSMTAGVAAAAAPTTGVIAPAADLVSALTAAQFSVHGALFQEVGAQAAAVHQQIAATLSSNGSAYAFTEAVNASSAG